MKDIPIILIKKTFSLRVDVMVEYFLYTIHIFGKDSFFFYLLLSVWK